MFVLLNRIQLMDGRKTSQQTLVEHISAETFPSLKVVSPLVRRCVPDYHVSLHFSNRLESLQEDHRNQERYNERRKYL